MLNVPTDTVSLIFLTIAIYGQHCNVIIFCIYPQSSDILKLVAVHEILDHVHCGFDRKRTVPRRTHGVV